jgi:phosphopantetheinyl transferase
VPQKRLIRRRKTRQLRKRQTVSDCSLRSRFAEWLNEDRRIKLQSAQFGKPFLVHSKGGINLRFNASHSSHIGVYAFCKRQDDSLESI